MQKTFNENRPDVNLATAVAVKPQPDPAAPLMAGRFGVGSWNTSTEFKELRMFDQAGKLVFSEDFPTMQNWDKPIVGKWQVKDGVLSQTDKGASPSMLLLKTQNLDQGRVTVKARRVDGTEGFLMFFNASGIDRFLFCNYGAAGNSFSAIQDRGVPAGCAFKGGRSTQGPIDLGRWYEISLVVGRDSAEMFLDGKRVSDARVEHLPAFFATAGYDVKSRTVVVKATNYHAKSVATEIQLDGVGNVGAVGRHIVINSAGQFDENTLNDPRRIVPHEQALGNCTKTFSVVLPPYSVNVLRIPVDRP